MMNKYCSPRSLKNGAQQGSSSLSLLFNIDISDLSFTQSYVVADDFTLLFMHKNLTKMEKTLALDMENMLVVMVTN